MNANRQDCLKEAEVKTFLGLFHDCPASARLRLKNVVGPTFGQTGELVGIEISRLNSFFKLVVSVDPYLRFFAS